MTYADFLKFAWSPSAFAKAYAGKGPLAKTPGDGLWLRDAKHQAGLNGADPTAGVSTAMLTTPVVVCTMLSPHSPSCCHMSSSGTPPHAGSSSVSTACPSDSGTYPSSAGTLHQDAAAAAAAVAAAAAAARVPLPKTSRATHGLAVSTFATQIERFGHQHGVNVYLWKDADIKGWGSRAHPAHTFEDRELCVPWSMNLHSGHHLHSGHRQLTACTSSMRIDEDSLCACVFSLIVGIVGPPTVGQSWRRSVAMLSLCEQWIPVP